ncbi:restriction endonuclease subunit S [Nitrosococcus wardiae]|uniref:restriction endonuclease subunit S n=1 Tax=Nitrosococcus wardiae TaxID=1814290 RepID=UPI00141A9461|nr:restriction endonuclease subunit S [Nitrosococcus wardiae]
MAVEEAAVSYSGFTAKHDLLWGYKQTEIGVIPKDWEVNRLDELADIDPDNLPSNTDPSYEFKYVSLEDVNEGTLAGFSEIKFRDAPSRARRKLRKGDILVSTVRPNLKSHFLFDRDESNWICSTGFSVVRCHEGKSLPRFVFFHLFDGSVPKQIDALLTGSNYPAINGSDVRALEIPVPSTLEEQTVIATALSDVDALIAALDKLIAKKRAIKTAAMQQLLTGKQRLPGFEGEWEVRQLGNLCERITTGKLDANAMVEGGEYPFFTCAREHYWIDKYDFDTEALLVSGNGANVGYIHYYKGKFNAYQRTYVLSGFNCNIHFLKLFMERKLQDRIRTEVNAGNTPYIVMGTLMEMNISLPSRKAEQTAIATILSDMDAEITALEARRDKTQAIKQGMMQELLTGRIRLV